MPELDAESLVDQVIDAWPGLARATPRGDGRCRGRIARLGAADAAAQGVAHELADRPAQEGRPLGLLLRRGEGALPPGGGDVRPGLPGRARRAAASRWRSRSSGSGSPRSPRRSHRFHKEAEAGHAAQPPQHRPDHRRGAAGEPPLHDHGVRRGDEPPRLPQAAHPDEGTPGAAADARPGRGHEVFARAGRHPPRHQGDQHPDLQLGGRQAGRLRPGHDRGGREQAGRQEPADRRLFGPRADVQEPQGRSPIGHLLPRLRVLPDGDRAVADGGVREQGHAQEDAGAVLRRDQADRRASVCARRGALRDHREDDEDRPEGPVSDHGRGGRRPRALQGVACRRTRPARPRQEEEDEFASIFALPPEPEPAPGRGAACRPRPRRCGASCASRPRTRSRTPCARP